MHRYIRSVWNSFLHQKTKLQQINVSDNHPQALGQLEKKTPPVLKSVSPKKLDAIHIPNPQAMFRKNTVLVFLSYKVIKAYMKD